VSYLQCPECRLTVRSTAYFLRGDECPRCMTVMEKRTTFRSTGSPAGAPVATKVTPATAKPSTA
jgi:hypothetical protein